MDSEGNVKNKGVKASDKSKEDAKMNKDSKDAGELSIVTGEHKAANITRSEAALNGKILRVWVKKSNFKDMENGSKKENVKQESSKAGGRQESSKSNVKQEFSKSNIKQGCSKGGDVKKVSSKSSDIKKEGSKSGDAKQETGKSDTKSENSTNETQRDIRMRKRRLLNENIKTNLIKRKITHVQLLKHRLRLKLKANAGKNIRQVKKLKLTPKKDVKVKANGQAERKLPRRTIKPNRKLFDFVDLDLIHKKRRSSQSSSSTFVDENEEVEKTVKEKNLRKAKKPKIEESLDDISPEENEDIEKTSKAKILRKVKKPKVEESTDNISPEDIEKTSKEKNLRKAKKPKIEESSDDNSPEENEDNEKTSKEKNPRKAKKPKVDENTDDISPEENEGIEKTSQEKNLRKAKKPKIEESSNDVSSEENEDIEKTSKEKNLRKAKKSKVDENIVDVSSEENEDIEKTTKEKNLRKAKKPKVEESADDIVTSFLPATLSIPHKANENILKGNVRKSTLHLRTKKDESPVLMNTRSRTIKRPLLNTKQDFKVKPIRRKNEKLKAKPPDSPKIAKKKPEIVQVSIKRKKLSKINGTKKELLNKRDVKRLVQPMSYYALTHSMEKPNKPTTKITFSFDTLVRNLKLIKLPAPHWKVRIMVTPKQQISEVTFSNKQEYERCVKFKRNVNGHTISLGGSAVSLLGAPDTFDTYDDVAVLLTIINFISVNDPVLKFSRNKNKL